MSRSSTNENYRNNDWIIYPLVCRLHTSLMLAGYFAIDHPCWLGQWDRDITDASWWFILSVLVVWVCRKLGYTLFEGYFHANISWWIPKKEWGTLYSDKAICCHRKKRCRPKYSLFGCLNLYKPAGYTPDGKLWALNESSAPFQFKLDEVQSAVGWCHTWLQWLVRNMAISRQEKRSSIWGVP